MKRTTISALLMIPLLGLGVGARADAADRGDLAADLIEKAGISRGICVVVGCDDPAFPLAVVQSTDFLVHAIDPRGEKVDAVRDAAAKIKDMLAGVAFAEYDLNQIHDIAFGDNRVFVRAKPKRGMAFGDCVYKALRARRGEPLTAFGFYTPRNKGLVTPTFSFGAQVAEVVVDGETGLVQVEQMYTAHDCGVPLNPLAVEGQLEGSIHMGLGYALSEELVMDGPRTVNTTLLDYKMPAAEDMPASEAVEIITTDSEGPFGAKEVGEGLVSPTAPAIADAVELAVGVRIRDLPITPEKVMRGLGKLSG